MKNLVPQLVRQRVIIEATTKEIVTEKQIAPYLIALSKELEMQSLSPPFTYPAKNMGFGGWIHWVSSGAHVYSYFTNPPLVTVDAYTCKPFSCEKAAEFTKKYFNAIELVWKEVKI